ncbi:hypothetical protein SAMD00019534_015220, partial [Acytostelium subglobosum LB1]|uniref:hypothetical protein n=1 Tax=Acytostelium subglobosum LB1 TaxID=1410327 RepID=UPI000644FDA5
MDIKGNIYLYTMTIVLLMIVSLTTPGQAFSFKVPAKIEECIYEELPLDASFTVMFQVTQGGFNDIDFTIISPDSRILYKGERESEGTKVMKASMEGLYSFCFSNQMSSLTEKTVSFMVVVGERSQMADLAKKGDITPLERQIVQLADGVQAILNEQNNLKMREITHRNTAESTNSRVTWWAFFEAVLLVTMSLWQIYYLRRFFEVKRAV